MEVNDFVSIKPRQGMGRVFSIGHDFDKEGTWLAPAFTT